MNTRFSTRTCCSGGGGGACGVTLNHDPKPIVVVAVLVAVAAVASVWTVLAAVVKFLKEDVFVDSKVEGFGLLGCNP